MSELRNEDDDRPEIWDFAPMTEETFVVKPPTHLFSISVSPEHVKVLGRISEDGEIAQFIESLIQRVVDEENDLFDMVEIKGIVRNTDGSKICQETFLNQFLEWIDKNRMGFGGVTYGLGDGESEWTINEETS